MEAFRKFFGVVTPVLACAALLIGLSALKTSRRASEIRSRSGAANGQDGRRSPRELADVSFEDKVKSVSEKVSPAVVSIELKPREEMLWSGMKLEEEDDPLYASESQLCYGSGVLFREEGYVLTSCHLLSLGNAVEALFPGGERKDARIVGMDPLTDIGVLLVEDPPELEPPHLGSSADLEVGEWVLAFGSPVHYGQTVTCGIVSAVGRQGVPVPSQMSSYADLIQTDAAINGGSSGGPLVNLKGEVVGVNSAIVTREGNYQGIGFAVPIDRAVRVAEELIRKGRVVRPWLGVGLQQLDRPLARALGLDEAMGALVNQLSPGCQGERAGLRRGDVIVQYDGISVEDTRHLQELIAMSQVGDTAAISVMRRGRPLELSVFLEERSRRVSQRTPARHRALPYDRFGLSVVDLTAFVAERLDLEREEGVLVSSVSPGSPADRIGVRAGDVLLEADGDALASERDYQRRLASLRGEGPYLFLLANDQGVRYVAISPEGRR